MPAKKPVCQKPWNLKGKPGECTPAQIRKCHDEDKTHACAKKSGRK